MIRILYEFADSKNDIKDFLRRNDENYLIHLAKIFFMRDRQELSHWKDEVYSFYSRVKKTKNKNKYPDPKFIYFNIYGKDEDSPKSIIENVYDKLDMDYSIKINKSYGNIFLKFVREYTKWLSQNLSDNGYVSRSDVRSKIDELLSKYKYSKEEN